MAIFKIFDPSYKSLKNCLKSSNQSLLQEQFFKNIMSLFISVRKCNFFKFLLPEGEERIFVRWEPGKILLQSRRGGYWLGKDQLFFSLGHSSSCQNVPIRCHDEEKVILIPRQELLVRKKSSHRILPNGVSVKKYCALVKTSFKTKV